MSTIARDTSPGRSPPLKPTTAYQLKWEEWKRRNAPRFLERVFSCWLTAIIPGEPLGPNALYKLHILYSGDEVVQVAGKCRTPSPYWTRGIMSILAFTRGIMYIHTSYVYTCVHIIVHGQQRAKQETGLSQSSNLQHGNKGPNQGWGIRSPRDKCGPHNIKCGPHNTKCGPHQNIRYQKQNTTSHRNQTPWWAGTWTVSRKKHLSFVLIVFSYFSWEDKGKS